MLLNLGSGDHRAPSPWINVDSWRAANPDVCASLLELPFADHSASYVYCGHVLEHLTFPVEVAMALHEIRRVLNRYGAVCIVGPDVDRIRTNPDWGPLLNPVLYGGQRWPGDAHRYGSTASGVLPLVRRLFPSAREVPVADVPSGWPVVDRSAGWQFAIIGW